MTALVLVLMGGSVALAMTLFVVHWPASLFLKLERLASLAPTSQAMMNAWTSPTPTG